MSFGGTPGQGVGGGSAATRGGANAPIFQENISERGRQRGWVSILLSRGRGVSNASDVTGPSSGQTGGGGGFR